MVAGRPPETYSDEEVIALGEDLLQWLENEGKGKSQFVRWYNGKHGMFMPGWKALKSREKFVPYHEMAMKMIAENIVLNEDIPQSYGNRYLCYYDRDLLDHEEEVKDRDSARRSKESINSPMLEEAFVRMNSFLDKVRSMQTVTDSKASADRTESQSDPASASQESAQDPKPFH